MGESWIVSNLNAALSTWNDKLAEIWSLLTESPQTFKGGRVWGVMTGIHSALQAIGYGLLVLFFAVGVMKTCGSFVEVKKPEHALKLFIRFALAKGAVTYGLELMLAVFSIVQGMCYLNLGTVCHPYKVWNTAITDWQGLWHPKESAKSQGNCYL